MSNILNFDNYLFHASAFSKLTTEPKLKADKEAGNLSETTKTFLKEIFLEQKYQRRKILNTKHVRKGLTKEEEAITLICRLHKKMYVKNTIRFENDFTTGEPDILDNTDITKIKKGVDAKCAWSLFSFPFADDKLDKAYEWQNQVYMSQTGAEEWTTAHCLVNAPGYMITDEKRKLYYSLNMPEETDEEYIKGCLEVEKNMIFNMDEFKKAEPGYDLTFNQYGLKWDFDISLQERVFEFHTPRDKFMIESIPEYAAKGRRYLNGLIKGEF